MTTLIAFVGAVSSLLFPGGGDPHTQPAEIGGKVVDAATNRALPAPLAADVQLFSDRACIAGAPVGTDGTFHLAAPPGQYWLRVNVGGKQATILPYVLRPGSWHVELSVPERPEPLASMGAPSHGSS